MFMLSQESETVQRYWYMAIWYAYGRYDAGETPIKVAEKFAFQYAQRMKAFDAQETYFMPSMRDAFTTWQAISEIVSTSDQVYGLNPRSQNYT
jgi:hypothetical protein